MSEQTAILRCDASPKIGGGHAMRCLVLAGALSEAGWHCTVATNPEAAQTVPALRGSGHDFMTVDPRGGEAEATALGAAVDGLAALLVVDHYGLDHHFEHAARRWAGSIMAIDDLADRAHDCDLLLDQSAGREAKDYTGLMPEGAVCLAGPNYALLRPQFRRARVRFHAERGQERLVRRVLVNFGMVDGKNVTPLALEAIRQAGMDADVDVVLGTAAAERQNIQALTAGIEQRVTIHENVGDMAGLMARADLCIGAAGTSALERCCTGLPSIVVVTAANQKAQAEALAAAGAILLAGMVPLNDPSALVAALKSLASDGAARAQLSACAFRVCDGLGVRRVLSELEPDHDKSGQRISLRPVEAGDCEQMFEWQILPGMRDQFDNSEPPTRAEHVDWFGRRLAGADGFYVIERDGRPAGVLRLDPEGDGQSKSGSGVRSVSILVAPDHAGAGVATTALKCALRLHAGDELVARIHIENLRSQRAFLRAGFRQDTTGVYRACSS